MTKQCYICKENKPLNCFHKNKSRKDGVTHECKDCKSEQHLLRKYGITALKYKQMLIKQNNACAICKTKTPGGKNNKFVVDHNHKTEEVRGLLCDNCNKAIGLLNDSPELLISAKIYLESTGS